MSAMLQPQRHHYYVLCSNLKALFDCLMVVLWLDFFFLELLFIVNKNSIFLIYIPGVIFSYSSVFIPKISSKCMICSITF